MIKKGFCLVTIVTLIAVSFVTLKNNRPISTGRVAVQTLASSNTQSNNGHPTVPTLNSHAMARRDYFPSAGQPRVIRVNDAFPHSVSPKPATVRSHLTSQLKLLAPRSHHATFLRTQLQQPPISQSTLTPGQNQTLPRTFLASPSAPQQSNIEPEFIHDIIIMSETIPHKSPEAVVHPETPVIVPQQILLVTTHEVIASPTRDTSLPVRKSAMKPKLLTIVPKAIVIDDTTPVLPAVKDNAILNRNKANRSPPVSIVQEIIPTSTQDTALPVRKSAMKPMLLMVAPRAITIDDKVSVSQAMRDVIVPTRNKPLQSSVVPWMQVFGIPGPEINRMVTLRKYGQINQGDDIKLISHEKLLFVDLSVTTHPIESLRPFFDQLRSPFLMIDMSWLAHFLNRLTQMR